MALIRSIPSRSISPIQSDFNRLFSSLFDTATPIAAPLARNGRGFIPALDVVERESEFLLTVDLPGLSESDVKVEILDGTLTISGERSTSNEENKDGYRRLERASGTFTRTLSLPKGVDPAAVTATFKNGVLQVTVPKPETTKPQQVQIAVDSAA